MTRILKLFGLAAVLCTLGAPKADASLMVEATVAPIGGGLFHYEFSVINDTLVDAILVTITDAPVGDPFIPGSLVTPAGFLASYDDGLGLVDFIADITPFFPLGTTGGFAFDSASGPAGNFTLFEARTIANFDPPAVTGQVNIIAAAVPAPGTLTLLVLGLWLLAPGHAVRQTRLAS